MSENVRLGPRAHCELPRWVWDLLIELQREEDEHPPYFREAVGRDGFVQWNWCPQVALELVPAGVLAQASAIGSYLRESAEPVDLSAARAAASDEVPGVEEKLAGLPRGSMRLGVQHLGAMAGVEVDDATADRLADQAATLEPPEAGEAFRPAEPERLIAEAAQIAIGGQWPGRVPYSFAAVVAAAVLRAYASATQTAGPRKMADLVEASIITFPPASS